ncbi:hypothetical protein KBC75_01465 [Candidatus Shapirobacteria bacterium]|nr:hypothetical protein [Candidatus Shapirobacteria bacterium]
MKHIDNSEPRIIDDLVHLAQVAKKVLRDQIPLYGVVKQREELRQEINAQARVVGNSPKTYRSVEDYTNRTEEWYLEGGSAFNENPYWPVLGKFMMFMNDISESTILPIALVATSKPTVEEAIALTSYHLIVHGIAGLNHQRELEAVRKETAKYTIK